VILLISLMLSITINSTPIESHPPSGQGDPSGSIVLSVTVTDKSGQAVMGLDKTAFTVYDNNVAQAISYFENANQPLSVGIIVGMHGSKSVA
jgi:hypothetical protein